MHQTGAQAFKGTVNGIILFCSMLMLTEVGNVVGFIGNLPAASVGKHRCRRVVFGAEILQQLAGFPTVAPRSRTRPTLHVTARTNPHAAI